jgi:hypothetical protein
MVPDMFSEIRMSILLVHVALTQEYFLSVETSLRFWGLAMALTPVMSSAMDMFNVSPICFRLAMILTNIHDCKFSSPEFELRRGEFSSYEKVDRNGMATSRQD